MKLFESINAWLDKKLDLIRQEEEKRHSFKLEPIKESKANWEKFYEQTPINPIDLRKK